MEGMQKTLNTMQSINTALKEKTEETEKALQAKEIFMATMSHEIRSPLHSIVALSSLLLESDTMSPDDHSMIKTIHTSSEHLITIVNDILDYAKIQSKKMELAPSRFFLHTFVESIVTITAPLVHPDVDLISTVDTIEDVELIGDVGRLKQICCNLMSNAAKFTHKGSVCLDVSLQKPNPHGTQNDDGSWHNSLKGSKVSMQIRVKDCGIGMSTDYITRMYTPFNQSDNSISRKYGGTGLGLAITKQLVDLFEGTIQCESSLGAGTVFTVTIPLQRKMGLSSSSSLSSSSEETPPSARTFSWAEFCDRSDNFSLQTTLFVLDSLLSKPIQDGLKHWMEMAGATVIDAKEYVDGMAGMQYHQQQQEEHESSFESGQLSSVLRHRRHHPYAVSGHVSVRNCFDSNSDGDENNNNNNNNPLKEDPSASIDADFSRTTTSCEGWVRQLKMTNPTSMKVICVCSQSREQNFMVEICQDTVEGRALVIVKGRAAQATAALRKVQAITPAPMSNRSHSQLWSQLEAAAILRSVVAMPSSSSGGQWTNPWMRVVLELPVTGSSVFRAVSSILNAQASFPPSSCDVRQSFRHAPTSVESSSSCSSKFSLPPVAPSEPFSLIDAPKPRKKPQQQESTRAGGQKIEIRYPSSSSSTTSSALSSPMLDSLSQPRSSFSSSPTSRDESRSNSTLEDGGGSSSNNETSQLRVLLVDDNAVNRKVGAQLLKRCGVVDFRFAEDGLEALEAVALQIAEHIIPKRGFDVVLMDLHMPVMDGAAAAQEILKRWPDASIRPVVVACTADVFASTNDALPLFLAKPFTLGQLQSILWECYELKQKYMSIN